MLGGRCSSGRERDGRSQLKVLYIEDSPSLQRSVAEAMRRSGYAVDVAGDGSDGLWRAESGGYDVVVLDVMLPGMDGIEVLRRLRDAGRDVHVLLLTARDAVPDRVAGLRAGADDYLTKPFAIDELLARVEALVRRRHGGKSPTLRFGDLAIDTAARAVRLGGVPVELTPREFAVLHLLALHPGEVVSRARIEAAVYDDKVEPMSNVVDAAVYAVRKKIDPPGGPSRIATRRGMGYAFVPAGDGRDGRDGEGPR
ncbi:MAG TPA: response regulator transcription factor [Humisphaera sp.]